MCTRHQVRRSGRRGTWLVPSPHLRRVSPAPHRSARRCLRRRCRFWRRYAASTEQRCRTRTCGLRCHLQSRVARLQRSPLHYRSRRLAPARPGRRFRWSVQSRKPDRESRRLLQRGRACKGILRYCQESHDLADPLRWRSTSVAGRRLRCRLAGRVRPMTYRCLAGAAPVRVPSRTIHARPGHCRGLRTASPAHSVSAR